MDAVVRSKWRLMVYAGGDERFRPHLVRVVQTAWLLEVFILSELHTMLQFLSTAGFVFLFITSLCFLLLTALPIFGQLVFIDDFNLRIWDVVLFGFPYLVTVRFSVPFTLGPSNCFDLGSGGLCLRSSATIYAHVSTGTYPAWVNRTQGGRCPASSGRLGPHRVSALLRDSLRNSADHRKSSGMGSTGNNLRWYILPTGFLGRSREDRSV